MGFEVMTSKTECLYITNRPGPDLLKIISSIKFRCACFEHSDWLLKSCQPTNQSQPSKPALHNFMIMNFFLALGPGLLVSFTLENEASNFGKV